MTQMEKIRLSDSEIETYQRDGLVVPDYRVPEATIEAMRRELDRLLADNPTDSSDIMLCPHDPHGSAKPIKGSQAWLEFARRRHQHLYRLRRSRSGQRQIEAARGRRRGEPFRDLSRGYGFLEDDLAQG